MKLTRAALLLSCLFLAGLLRAADTLKVGDSAPTVQALDQDGNI